jgi:hypothetical protein
MNPDNKKQQKDASASCVKENKATLTLTKWVDITLTCFGYR